MQVSNAQVRPSSSIMSIEAYLASRNLTVCTKPTTQIIKIDAFQPKRNKKILPSNPFEHIHEGRIHDEEMKYLRRMFRGKVNETTPVICSSQREPMLARGEEHGGRKSTRRSIGIGKRKPTEVTLYRKDSSGDWNYEKVLVTQCEKHIVTYAVKNQNTPRYKNVPRGENPKSSGHFRVKHLRNQNGDLVV